MPMISFLQVCNKGFKWKHALKAHIVVHSSEKKFLCQECGFSTKQSSTFRFHQVSLPIVRPLPENLQDHKISLLCLSIYLLAYMGVFGLSVVRFLRRSGATQTKTSFVNFVNHIEMKVHVCFFFLFMPSPSKNRPKREGTSFQGDRNN